MVPNVSVFYSWSLSSCVCLLSEGNVRASEVTQQAKGPVCHLMPQVQSPSDIGWKEIETPANCPLFTKFMPLP